MTDVSIRGRHINNRDDEERDALIDDVQLKGHKGISNRLLHSVSHQRFVFLSGLVLILLIILLVETVGLGYLIIHSEDASNEETRIPACYVDGKTCVGHRQRFKKSAVAADSPICSQIGAEILNEKGGSIVDSGIATLLCLGAVHLHSSGIGGGGFYLFHNRTASKTYGVNARETAPLKAFKEMYKHDYNASINGGLSIAVPGELAGYAALHAKFGKLSWTELFTPTINLCKNGFAIGVGLNIAIQAIKGHIPHDPAFEGLKEILVNPKTGDVYQMGDILRLPRLAKTLQRVADLGAGEFYHGQLAKDIAEDIKDARGIITEQDLNGYKTKSEVSIAIKLSDGKLLHTMQLPSSGSLGALLYNIMSGYKWRTDTLSCQAASVLFHHRITEAWKYTYALRHQLGDPNFIDVKDFMKNITSQQFADSIRSKIDDEHTYPPEHYGPVGQGADDHGTTHLSIMDDEGNAFAATSTINHYFGSKIVGRRTGILFDDTMNDFSIPGKPDGFGIPPSEENFIVPGKRPMSTMSPTIITDKDGDVIMIAGASGGSKILTATSYVILRTLLLNDDLKTAIDVARIHHQWVPNRILYELPLEKYLLEGLRAKGHEMFPKPDHDRGAVVQGLFKGFIQAYCDVRKGGCPAGYN